jgi:hypothetical protein
MVILTEKLISISLKFPFKLEEDHHRSCKASPASLHDFRSKISDFLSQTLLNHPGNGSESLSLERFHCYFDLIHISNRAFEKLVVESDYPMSQWGGKATEEYLNYTLNMLDLLNSIFSSISYLNQANISMLHALSLIENSPSSSTAKHLEKIPGRNIGRNFKLKGSSGIVGRTCSDGRKETVIVQALAVLKRVGFLALGLMVSGLWGEDKPYQEIRKFPGRIDEDPTIKVLDSIICEEMREIQGGLAEVKEVNRAAEQLSAAVSSAGRCDESLRELNGRLEALEKSIRGIEMKANNLFSEVLAARNKLLDNIRFMAQNP